MNEFQVAQLIHLVIIVDADDEVQRCVPSVEHFILPMVQEGALNERIKSHRLPGLLHAKDTF